MNFRDGTLAQFVGEGPYVANNAAERVLLHCGHHNLTSAGSDAGGRFFEFSAATTNDALPSHDRELTPKGSSIWAVSKGSWLQQGDADVTAQR
jgi:hypothetical protein